MTLGFLVFYWMAGSFFLASLCWATTPVLVPCANHPWRFLRWIFVVFVVAFAFKILFAILK